MNAVLQDQPLPARLVPWDAAQHTTMARCVLLALLLHLWLVLLLGNAPGGTAPPGEGVWGAINVTLRGPESPGASEQAVPAVPIPTPTPNPAAAAEAEAARWGGTVRQEESAPEQTLPGAQRLGLPAPRQPEALQQLERPAQRTVEALPSLPAAPQALPERAAPQALPERAAPQALPERAAPQALPERAAPQPVLEPVQPAPSPPPPVAVERALNSSLDRTAVQPSTALPRDAAAAATALPDLAALPTPGAGPAPLRQLAPAPSAAAARAAEPALPRPTTAESLDVPRALPNPGQAITSPGAEAPDAGTRVGHDVATPAAAAASQPPRLNLELPRQRGGELSRYSTAGALPVLPRPPEKDDKLAREIEKAGKTDCRKAYADAGVLAVVPLVADAVKGTGCKW
jgi:hypothetical protein